jgi:hypothetical protein
MSQHVHQKGAPARVPARHSQGEAGWELDLHSELTAGAEKGAPIGTYAWAPLPRQMYCQFALIVTATAVSEHLRHGGLAQLIWQDN